VATLLLKLRDRELQRLGLVKSPTIIGRDGKCDLVIDNPSVSRRHASIEFRKGEGFVIFDIDSANGLFFGGKKVSHKGLADGDEIQLGKFTITFIAQGGVATNQLRHVSKMKGPEDGEYATETVNLPPDYMLKLRDAWQERDSARYQREEIENTLARQTRNFRMLIVLLSGVVAALLGAIVVLLVV
jgi:pSer/pThr/pTyr-binding forkhead associated (FHA) protein